MLLDFSQNLLLACDFYLKRFYYTEIVIHYNIGIYRYFTSLTVLNANYGGIFKRIETKKRHIALFFT
jgi:hypothetical protein